MVLPSHHLPQPRGPALCRVLPPRSRIVSAFLIELTCNFPSSLRPGAVRGRTSWAICDVGHRASTRSYGATDDARRQPRGTVTNSLYGVYVLSGFRSNCSAENENASETLYLARLCHGMQMAGIDAMPAICCRAWFVTSRQPCLSWCQPAFRTWTSRPELVHHS